MKQYKKFGDTGLPPSTPITPITDLTFEEQPHVKRAIRNTNPPQIDPSPYYPQISPYYPPTPVPSAPAPLYSPNPYPLPTPPSENICKTVKRHLKQCSKCKHKNHTYLMIILSLVLIIVFLLTKVIDKTS